VLFPFGVRDMDNSNRPQTGFILGEVLDLGLNEHRRCEVIHGKADVEWRHDTIGPRMFIKPLEDVCVVKCTNEVTPYPLEVLFTNYKEIRRDIYIYVKEIEGWIWWSE
jgi:hypothetical protein